MDPYLWTGCADLLTIGDYYILQFSAPEEDERSSWEDEGEGLDELSPLRADILQSDLRSLYLASLLGIVANLYLDNDEDEAEAELEPSVPSGLGQLTPALEAFIRFMRIDPFLVDAAAEASHCLLCLARPLPRRLRSYRAPSATHSCSACCRARQISRWRCAGGWKNSQASISKPRLKPRAAPSVSCWNGPNNCVALRPRAYQDSGSDEAHLLGPRRPSPADRRRRGLIPCCLHPLKCLCPHWQDARGPRRVGVRGEYRRAAKVFGTR